MGSFELNVDGLSSFQLTSQTRFIFRMLVWESVSLYVYRTSSRTTNVNCYFTVQCFDIGSAVKNNSTFVRLYLTPVKVWAINHQLAQELHLRMVF